VITTVILCGGKGVRAYPYTETVPKPLIDVGGKPILHHVMDIYAQHGFTDFVLAAGYRKDAIDDFAERVPSEWSVAVIDTGEDTNTGARIAAVAELVSDDFFVTYGDGVGDVDLTALLKTHHEHHGLATLTTVPLPSQYGTVDFDGDGRVIGFVEKPRLADHHINAGFMVLDRRCFDAWPVEGNDLEREVLPAFASARELFVYEHHGFWKSLDTYKDALELNALCGDGPPPWLR
jgi:glucose-1-phosphate cytidylyltransferase